MIYNCKDYLTRIFNYNDDDESMCPMCANLGKSKYEIDRKMCDLFYQMNSMCIELDKLKKDK